ncbi:MAG: phosphate/phosphite/phosphonate ABC transporter substrate-binding protein [Fusobacterium sp.]|uniref:phosphate/phosphite/phosphonate ABC transporter substrate-binding protein n=1 Tax=Fusobacterium sp. TaxID=68766 RepID=UPI0026DCDFB2|nr:phosphate/phosphite/phosphonate ABC transporter substrate-binding protein [Fusobacterium sp.]MDO4690121.1 phosphate/phosphite/phosphonate ABC transporter substrate-binding protein [Fusobacterium sp.]
MKKRLILFTSIILSILILLLGCGKKKEEKALVMGLVPLSNSEKLIEETAPLHNMLTEKIGKKVEGFIATNYIGVVEALGTGTIDFALIPPFAYILANKKHGSEALLTSLNKNNEPGYYSVLIVRNDLGIEKVSDLKGKKIAFVDPSSTSGYIFPAVILMDNGIDIERDIRYQFAGGHDKALQLLINGDVDAIGTYENAFKKFSKEFPEIEKKTKIIEKSDLIPGVTLTVSSKIDDSTKNKIKQAFIDITEEKEGQELLLNLFGLKGFQEADKNNYDNIRIKLEKLGIDIEKVK